MLAERLQKAWLARAGSGGVLDRPALGPRGLTLGAGTVLAEPGADGDDPDRDARLRALLAAAYGRAVGPSALNHLKAAAGRWRQGDGARAATHLALARLDRLRRPQEDARRLFMADGLMRAGVSPQTVLDALGLGAEATDPIQKYSPGQPRVPAGNGRPSGRWTRDGAGGQPNVRPVRHISAAAVAATAGRIVRGLDLAGMSDAALAGVASFLEGVATSGLVATGVAAGGAVTVFGVLFIPNRVDRGKWVHVGGRGDVSFFRAPDETAIHLRYTTADGLTRTMVLSPGPDGEYRGPDGHVIARWIKTGIKAGLVISTAALVGADSKEPDLCPIARPDHPGARENNRDYEDFIKKMVNPERPTPRGMGYGLTNPENGREVVFDDCQHETGAMIEIKGPGYGRHFQGKRTPVTDNMGKGFLEQSERQVSASGARPLIWIFDEWAAMQGASELVKKHGGREKIVFEHIPWVK